MSGSPAVLDGEFARLKASVIEATGLAYYADKDEELAGRMARRMARLGIADWTSYLRVLEQGEKAEELDGLISELTIGETYFFRQPEQFAALAQVVLPDILERNASARRLRVWSAGCATGAEPYSLAILLRREFAGRLAGWEVSILATDINREFLARAREARFQEWALRATPEDVRDGCFRRQGNLWTLAPEYRDCVSFQYHNLVRDPFPSLVHSLCAFDLILCRNVLIYFSREVIGAVVRGLRECLVEHGWLLVGHAEPGGELLPRFRHVSCAGATLYQKAARAREPATIPAPPRPVALPDVPAAPAAPAPSGAQAPAAAETPASELVVIRQLADRGEWEKAEICARRLLHHGGLQPAAHFYHGLVLEQMGRAAEAESALRRAVYLDRGFVLAHYHLGLLLGRDHPEGARRAFRTVLQLLAPMDTAHVLADCDGITSGELAALARTHLQVLEGARAGREAGW